MLSITGQKIPVTLAPKIIARELENAREHKEDPEIANYFYERVEIALHKLAEHEEIKSPSFYDKKHYIRSARAPDTPELKALQKSIADVHFERAEVFSQLNEWDKAKAQYKNAYKWGHPSAEEQLRVLAQRSARPSSPFGSLRSLHKLTPSSSSAVSTFSPARLSPPVFNAEEAPAFKFFLKNLPLNPPALPLAGQSLRNTEQLAYCLLLLTLDQQAPASTTELSAEELAWLARVKHNQDDPELRLLAQDVIRAFEKDELKNASAVAEAVALAPVYALDDFQKLLNKFITKLSELQLLDFDVLHGLAQMIRHAPPHSLRTDDLVKILDNLGTRLKNTHVQSGENQYRLAMAICQVLDAMADNQVTDLNREALHQPLKDFFNGLKQSSDPYLMYQAEYACQALAHVPDDETPWQGAWRRIGGVFHGVMKFTKAAKVFDVEGFIDGVKDLQKPASELLEFTLETYDRVMELRESGQALIESLKEGFSFDRKHVWYPMLRGFDEVPSDQLNTFKQKLMQPELQFCRGHKTFLWGLSERLAQLAANPEQAPDTRKQALQWLSELYEDDQTWSKHPIIKQRVVQLIRTLADHSPVKKDANEWVSRLQTVGDATQQTFYQGCLNEPLTPYPLYVARPQPISFSLLDKVQNKQWLETDLHRLRAECLDRWRDMLYVPPQGKTNLFAADTETFDLAKEAEAFFKNHQNKKMALVLGDSGAGKSTFLRFLEATLWKSYQKNGPIPLFIPLPTIDNPEQDFIAKHLRRLNLTQAQIKTLKETRDFIVIADGYDESGANENLYQCNRFNQPGGWRGQLIVGCRSQHLGDNYRPRFQPNDPTLFQEWVVAPFGQAQIDQYVQEHVDKHKAVTDDRFDLQHWQVQDYQRGLAQIDDNFKRTPLLLKTALEVLPRLLILGEQGQTASSLTRAVLYDEAMKARFEREKQRLQGAGLGGELEDAFKVLDREGFVKHGMQFVTQLAVAVYEKNQGNPVIEYDPFTADKGSWKDEFFGRDRYQSILREAWPLICSDNQYRFEHKSFLEYFASRDICQPQKAESTVMAKMGGTPRSGIAARRGSNASLLSFESQDTLPEVSDVEVVPLLDSLLTRRNLIKEPAIIQFLVERVRQEPLFKQQLRVVIDRSKTDSTARKAAANAITILVRAGVQFNGSDLKGIQIPGADLSEGVFDSAQLQGADLRKTHLRNSWLRQANLSGAKMEGAKFGEWPYLQEEMPVQSCVYSPDGKTCAVNLYNGEISVYATSNWEKIFTLVNYARWGKNMLYSPNGAQLASSNLGDETIRLWDSQSGQLIRTLEGHTDSVESVVYSPHGAQLASSSADNTVRLWDAQSGQLIHTLEGHTKTVCSVVYSSSGAQLASSSYDNTVRLWDAQSGQLIRTLEGHTYSVKSVVYSPHGAQLASSSADNTVRLWDAQSGQLTHTLNGVNSVVYSPNGAQLAVGSNDTVQLWDAQSGQLMRTLSGHTSSITSVVYSPSGAQIVSSSYDETVRLWDAQSGQLMRTLSGHTHRITSVVYSPSGAQLASSSEDKTVRLWDSQSGQLSPILSGHTNEITSVACSSSGAQLASSSKDKTVQLWGAQNGQVSHTLLGHTGSVGSVLYSPSGAQLASSSVDNTVRLWDAQSGQLIHTLSDHPNEITSGSLSTCGPEAGERASTSGTVESSSWDRPVNLWNEQENYFHDIFSNHTDWAGSVVYSPSGAQLATRSWSKTIRLWDAQSGQLSHTLEGHTALVNSMVYSPSEAQLASSSWDETVRLWDVHSGQLSHTLEGHTDSVGSVLYSPNGAQLASSSVDETIRLWGAHSGQLTHTLWGHTGEVTGVVYSPSGAQLASRSRDETIRLWDTQSGQLSHTLEGHTGFIWNVLYSPNGAQLASSSVDNTVRLWDTQSGECLTVVRDFWGEVKSIAWRETTDGTYLVAGCGDKSVRVWQIMENGDQVQVRLHWSSTHDRLTVTDTVIQGVQGLSQVNKKLLQQRGAVGEPASRLAQTGKKVMNVAAAVSQFKAPLKRQTLETPSTAQPPSVSSSLSTKERHLFSHLA